MSWARSVPAIQWKAFKTLPAGPRYLRPRSLLAMEAGIQSQLRRS